MISILLLSGVVNVGSGDVARSLQSALERDASLLTFSLVVCDTTRQDLTPKLFTRLGVSGYWRQPSVLEVELFGSRYVGARHRSDYMYGLGEGEDPVELSKAEFAFDGVHLTYRVADSICGSLEFSDTVTELARGHSFVTELCDPMKWMGVDLQLNYQEVGHSRPISIVAERLASGCALLEHISNPGDPERAIVSWDEADESYRFCYALHDHWFLQESSEMRGGVLQRRSVFTYEDSLTRATDGCLLNVEVETYIHSISGVVGEGLEPVQVDRSTLLALAISEPSRPHVLLPYGPGTQVYDYIAPDMPTRSAGILHYTFPASEEQLLVAMEHPQVLPTGEEPQTSRGALQWIGMLMLGFVTALTTLGVSKWYLGWK